MGGAIARHSAGAYERSGPHKYQDLRSTTGLTQELTRVAASGEVSLRTLQEWMGHRDPKTALIYADYQPGERESEIVERAFEAGSASTT